MHMRNRPTIIILSVAFAAIAAASSCILAPHTVRANGQDYVALTPLTLQTGDTSILSTKNFIGCTKAEFAAHACLPKYLRWLYTAGVLLAGFLAVFSIVRGGFSLLWTDSILAHSEGKGIILRAIGGVLIVYSSYILMNAINPQLAQDLNLSLAFPQIKAIKPTGGLVPTTEEDIKLLEKARADAQVDIKEASKLEGEIATLEDKIKTAGPAEAAALKLELQGKEADKAIRESSGTLKLEQGAATVAEHQKDVGSIRTAKGVIDGTFNTDIKALTDAGRIDEAQALRFKKVTTDAELDASLWATNVSNAFGSSAYTNGLSTDAANAMKKIKSDTDGWANTVRDEHPERASAIQTTAQNAINKIKSACAAKNMPCKDFTP